MSLENKQFFMINGLKASQKCLKAVSEKSIVKRKSMVFMDFSILWRFLLLLGWNLMLSRAEICFAQFLWREAKFALETSRQILSKTSTISKPSVKISSWPFSHIFPLMIYRETEMKSWISINSEFYSVLQLCAVLDVITSTDIVTNPANASKYLLLTKISPPYLDLKASWPKDLVGKISNLGRNFPRPFFGSL